jgi:hypothetical protein
MRIRPAHLVAPATPGNGRVRGGFLRDQCAPSIAALRSASIRDFV